MRRDSYLGLKGLVSCHGVNFPGTPLSRSLSRVFGNVSRQSSRTGFFFFFFFLFYSYCMEA